MNRRFLDLRLSAFAAISVCALLLGLTSTPSRAEPPAQAPDDVSLWLAGAGVGFEGSGGVWGAGFLGTVGGQVQQLKTLKNRKFELQWNAGALGLGGIIANQIPSNEAYGFRAHLGGTAGLRTHPAAERSFYLAVGGQAEGHALTLKGVPFTATDTVNNLGELGGIAGTLKFRQYLGESFLKNNRSLLIALFGQEELDSPLTNTPGKFQYGGGVLAQYLVGHRFALDGEASYVTTNQTNSNIPGQSSESNRWALAGGATETFWKNRLYANKSISVSREQDVLKSNGFEFNTAEPVVERLSLSAGVNFK